MRRRLGLLAACAVLLATQLACTPEQWQIVCEHVAADDAAHDPDVCRWLPGIAERWPVEEWGNALIIVRYESHGQPDAANWGDPSGGSHGLFQINGVHGYTVEAMRNPDANMDAAHRLWLKQGWRPWAAKRFLR